MTMTLKSSSSTVTSALPAFLRDRSKARMDCMGSLLPCVPRHHCSARALVDEPSLGIQALERETHERARPRELDAEAALVDQTVAVVVEPVAGDLPLEGSAHVRAQDRAQGRRRRRILD